MRVHCQNQNILQQLKEFGIIPLVLLCLYLPSILSIAAPRPAYVANILAVSEALGPGEQDIRGGGEGVRRPIGDIPCTAEENCELLYNENDGLKV